MKIIGLFLGPRKVRAVWKVYLEPLGDCGLNSRGVNNHNINRKASDALHSVCLIPSWFLQSEYNVIIPILQMRKL